VTGYRAVGDIEYATVVKSSEGGCGVIREGRVSDIYCAVVDSPTASVIYAAAFESNVTAEHTVSDAHRAAARIRYAATEESKVTAEHTVSDAHCAAAHILNTAAALHAQTDRTVTDGHPKQKHGPCSRDIENAELGPGVAPHRQLVRAGAVDLCVHGNVGQRLSQIDCANTRRAERIGCRDREGYGAGATRVRSLDR